MHPLVLLSVADHHARSIGKSSNKRIVGVLLGQDNGKIVNVANSFAVPFEEDEKDSKTWFLDHNYIEQMWLMFKKVNGTSNIIVMSRIFCEQVLSSGTHDWVVSLWAEIASVRS